MRFPWFSGPTQIEFCVHDEKKEKKGVMNDYYTKDGYDVFMHADT